MRVVIADDHRLILDGIRRALEADGSFEIVGETLDGGEVVDLVDKTRPDLVVLDVRMPGMDGLDCLDAIRSRYPETKVVVLSASPDEVLIETALRRGASAYVLKTVEPADLPGTLRAAIDGTVFSAIGVSEAGGTSGRAAGLTERELAILRAVSRGLSNDEIAKELWVARQTVKFHLSNVYRKLGVRNRAEAVREALARGLADERLPRTPEPRA